jgi:hypothetical protein
MHEGGDTGLNRNKEPARETTVNIEGDADSQQTITTSLNGRPDVWRPEHNTILAEWADKAMCYRWLHFSSFQKYHSRNIWFTIPVIIISTLTGTANFATGQCNVTYITSIIGAFNIIAGIISTIQHFLKISELNESHKMASLSWDKFYRNIKVELSKCPEDRISAHHMLKLYKEEYDRLMETSPDIDDDILQKFKQTFKSSDTFLHVQKPEICSELVPTFSTIYKEPIQDMQPVPPSPGADIALKTANLERMRAEFAMEKMKSALSNVSAFKGKQKIVEEFLQEFESINNRKPLSDEIMSNLKNRIDQASLTQIVKDLGL